MLSRTIFLCIFLLSIQLLVTLCSMFSLPVISTSRELSRCWKSSSSYFCACYCFLSKLTKMSLLKLWQRQKWTNEIEASKPLLLQPDSLLLFYLHLRFTLIFLGIVVRLRKRYTAPREAYVSPSVVWPNHTSLYLLEQVWQVSLGIGFNHQSLRECDNWKYFIYF